MIPASTMKLDFKCVIPCTKFNLHLRFRVVYLACTQAWQVYLSFKINESMSRLLNLRTISIVLKLCAQQQSKDHFNIILPS